MTALLLLAMEVATATGQAHVAKLGHGVVARDLGDGNVEVACEQAPETNAAKVERLRRELRDAELAVIAERVNKQRARKVRK